MSYLVAKTLSRMGLAIALDDSDHSQTVQMEIQYALDNPSLHEMDLLSMVEGLLELMSPAKNLWV